MNETFTPAPGSSGQRATAREFFAVVFRRRWLILGLFLATTATVLVVAFTTPVVYISTGRVLVRRGEQQSLLIPDRHLMNDWEADLGNEVETAKSLPVLTRAQEMLDAHPGPGGHRLRIQTKEVDAEVLGKSNVMGIAYGDRNPDVAQRVCEAIINAYVEYRQSSILAYPKKFFDTEIAAATADLDLWSRRRRDYADREGVVDLTEQKRNQISLLSELTRVRTETAADLAEAQSQQRAMRDLQGNPDVDMPTIATPNSNESSLNEIKRHIVEEEGRVAQLKERYRDDAPEVTNALATVETLRGLLRREVEARLQISHSRIDVAQARLAVLDREIATQQGQLESMPSKEMTIAEMDRQIADARRRLEDLGEKSEQAKITENTVPSYIVYVLSPAGPPTARNTRDYVRLGLAPAFSIVVGIGLAFFIDGLDLTVHTAGQAEAEIDLPVLAAITERRRRTG
jgi:succinoglycan biosynthesis transport protein ExoP